MDTAKAAVLNLPANYPGPIIGFLLVLILIIIYLVFIRDPSAKKEKATAQKKKKASDPGDDEGTCDDLIEEIHNKQKKNK